MVILYVLNTSAPRRDGEASPPTRAHPSPSPGAGAYANVTSILHGAPPRSRFRLSPVIRSRSGPSSRRRIGVVVCELDQFMRFVNLLIGLKGCWVVGLGLLSVSGQDAEIKPWRLCRDDCQNMQSA